MHYWIYLKDKNGEPELFQDSLLDIYPKRALDLMEPDHLPAKRGMCDKCHLDTHCHVMEEIGEYTSRKLCPILFINLVKPPWKLSDIM